MGLYPKLARFVAYTVAQSLQASIPWLTGPLRHSTRMDPPRCAHTYGCSAPSHPASPTLLTQ